MIRYEDALDHLEEKINTESDNWLARAATRTALFANAGRYYESYTETDPVTGKETERRLAPFWGDIKSVYVKLQHNKCIYCEKKVEGKAFASVEWDLEHFRPKGRIRRWPKNGLENGYDFPTGGDADNGYYLLAYQPLNYAAACKTCNSPFKSDHFPVLSERIQGKLTPNEYTSEHPLLVYPLGAGDKDPADLIRFVGVKALPRHQKAVNPERWRLGRVMIDFFGLNRDGLTKERADWLVEAVWPNFRLAKIGDPVGIKNLDRIRSERAPFTNCSRCFLDVCSRNEATAGAMVSQLEKIVRVMEE